jgi:hypothetical protein
MKILTSILLLSSITYGSVLNAADSSMIEYTKTQLDIKDNDKPESPTALMCLSDMSFGMSPSMNLGLDLASSLTGATESIGEVGAKATNLVADTIANITESLTGNAMMMNMAIESAAYTLAFMECTVNTISSTQMSKFSTCMETANESSVGAGGNAGIKMGGKAKVETKTKPAIMAKCAQEMAADKMDAIWECTKKHKNEKIDEIIKMLNKKIQASMKSIKETSKTCKADKEMEMSVGLTVDIVENGFKQMELKMLEAIGEAPIYKSSLIKKLNATEYILTNEREVTLFESFIIKAYETPLYKITSFGKKPNGSSFENGIAAPVREDFVRFANYLYLYIEDAEGEINNGNYSAKKYRNLIKMLKNKNSNKTINTLYSPFTSKKTMWNCVDKRGNKTYLYDFKIKDYFTKEMGMYEGTPSDSDIFINTLQCKNNSGYITRLNILTSSLSNSIVNLLQKEIKLGSIRYKEKLKKEINDSKPEKIEIKDEIPAVSDTPNDVYILTKELYMNDADLQGSFDIDEEE